MRQSRENKIRHARGESTFCQILGFDMPFRDDWPKMPDGSDFDGRSLISLVHSDNSPFDDKWDVDLLIHEIEDNLSAKVVDIPRVSKGSNNYVSCGRRRR
jgi:hypothetical protein